MEINEDIRKKLTISSENLRNINLFIEIILFINIQHYLIKISKKMTLNLKFITKIPKQAKDNEIIFLKEKNIKSNYLKPLVKSVFLSKLFNHQNFLKKDYNGKSYVFVNCIKSKKSLEFEKLGSKLFEYLKSNKIENSIVNDSNNKLTGVQLEKILHGFQLKSYNFNIYKTENKKNEIINLSVVGINAKKSNWTRI